MKGLLQATRRFARVAIYLFLFAALKPVVPSRTYEATRRASRIARILGILGLGIVVIAAGLFLSLPTVPGPGFLVILAGLAILATEFLWARRLLDRLKQKLNEAKDRLVGPSQVPPAREKSDSQAVSDPGKPPT